MKRMSLILAVAVLMIALYAVGTAVAAKVTVVVKGGPLDIQQPFADQDMADVVLDGTDQTSLGSLGETIIRDARGEDLGWYVNVVATDFVEESDPLKTISATGFRVSAAPAVTVLNGFDGGIVTDWGALNAPLTLLDSATSSRGRFSVTPDLELDVPAETYIGTYASTVTETLTSN